MTLDTLRQYAEIASAWSIPLIVLVIVGYAQIKGIKIYDVFVDGAKEGFDIAVRIMPFLVAILVAIGIFRSSGAMAAFGEMVQPVTDALKLPIDNLVHAMMRPLSGSGSGAILVEIMDEHGADSYQGILASVIAGSTETTFYVLALYFGSVDIKQSRHAVIAGLAGDFAGVAAAVAITYAFYGDLYKLPTP